MAVESYNNNDYDTSDIMANLRAAMNYAHLSS